MEEWVCSADPIKGWKEFEVCFIFVFSALIHTQSNPPILKFTHIHTNSGTRSRKNGVDAQQDKGHTVGSTSIQ